MSELLPCVEVEPRSASASSSVIWLHGLGASGHDFEPVVPYLGLPEARFVFPHAPPRPVTINGGMVMPAWYDIRQLGPGGAVLADVRRSQEQVELLLRRERQRGVPSGRIVLAGFSQGAAVALYTGLRHRHALAGIMVLSGYDLTPETRAAEESDANRRTPVLFCHGSYDPLLPVALGRAAFESLAAGERPVDWHEFPIGHEVSAPEIETVGSWLRGLLA